MNKIIALGLILFNCIICFSACKNSANEKTTAAIIETEDSGIKDPKAVSIADKVMEAMGGQQKWADLKYVSWTFFGSRHLTWDKLNHRVRIENPKDTSIYLVDLNDGSGKLKKGENVTLSTDDPKSVSKGKSIWINDMYWLFMPFKLTDPGVNLKYLRQDTTQTGAAADVLELTFNDVGDTPENKYEVFIDQSDSLVKQWNFFSKASDIEPARIWPWDNYKSYNGLKLSAERSDNGGPSNVKVYAGLDESVFTEF